MVQLFRILSILIAMSVIPQATASGQIPRTPMTIDIWSDISYPFCYLGKRHLELALDRLGLQGEVKVVWHSAPVPH
jgi:hypothetical protein